MDILDITKRGHDCLVSSGNKGKTHQQCKVKGACVKQQYLLDIEC